MDITGWDKICNKNNKLQLSGIFPFQSINQDDEGYLTLISCDFFFF